MNLSSLAKTLMKKTVDVSGDAARPIALVMLSDTQYDTDTGDFTTVEEIVDLGTALFGLVAETESARYKLAVTTHKAVIPMLNWEKTGSRYPEASDRVLVGTSVDQWQIEKVAEDSMESAIILFMSKP